MKKFFINIKIISSLVIKILIIHIMFLSQCYSETYDDYDSIPSEFKQKWESLLHYDNGKSVINEGSGFFLSPLGHMKPDQELIATIRYFKQDPIHCSEYPARCLLITGKTPNIYLDDFDEYQKNINIENVKLVFASENANSPVSAMGHVFLVIEGLNHRKIYKKHSIGFVADKHKNSNLLINFLTDTIIGNYSLIPYDDTIYEYISEENRSLWEYDLGLSNIEKKWLFYHLFELKSHDIKYGFFNNNCATGLSKVLEVISHDFEYKGRLYTTPIEYVKYIKLNTNRVQDITIRPSIEDKNFLDDGYIIDPIKTPKVSRITLNYEFNNELGSGSSLEFLPLYNDLFEHYPYKWNLTESKFFEIKSIFFKNRIRINEFNLINVKSIPDIQSKELKINFGLQFVNSIVYNKKNLYPDLHVGTGFHFGYSQIKTYLTTDVGIYFNSSNPNYYLNNQFGFFILDHTFGKINFSYNYVLSNHQSYRGYQSSYNFYYSKNLGNDWWISAKVNLYLDQYKRDNKNISIGISYRF